MSMIDQVSKKILVESMRRRLCGILKESTTLTSKQATEKSKFINENATYEQLLNITFNPKRTEKYLPEYVLEGAVAIIHRACLTGRKVIGPNAITEGALKLERETGKVITESMLDAALSAVTEGCGLNVVRDVITESSILMEDLAELQRNILHIDPARLSSASAMIGTSDAATKSVGIQDVIRLVNGSHLENSAKQQVIRAIQAQPEKAQQIINNASLSYAALNGHAADIGSNFETSALNKGRDYFRNNLYNTFLKKPATPPTVDPRVSAAAENFARKGGTPWGKIAAGAAAAGAGLWAWNRYRKNKEAMDQSTGYTNP